MALITAIPIVSSPRSRGSWPKPTDLCRLGAVRGRTGNRFGLAPAGVSADAFLSRSPFDESAGYGRIGDATAGMRSRQTRPRSNRQGTVNDDTAGGVVGQRATSAAGPEAQRSVALPRRDSWRMDDDASRRLLDVAPVAILGQRLDGSVSYANPAAARLFGWERDEMLGRNVEETFIADQNRHRDVEVMGILTSDRSWSGELPLRHRDGTVFPGHVTATLTRDARGEPDGIVGTVVDLRPIYSARAEVADVEARFRALIERIPLVTYIDQLTPEETSIYVSPQIEGLLGYPRDQFIGSQDFFLSIIHPDDRERVLAVMGEGRVADLPSLVAAPG